ncbi:MAG: inositol-3-phosphate synthase [Candidatus Kariarchaeaceae archaeon]
MGKIRVALAGVGNASSGLVQGIVYYSVNNTSEGLANQVLGGYTLADIEIVAAFDVDNRKVGKDLSEAIIAPPNAFPSVVPVPNMGVIVNKGPTLDGISGPASESVEISTTADADVTKILKETNTDMLVCLTPTGGVKACEFYAQASLDAGIGFVNCSPTPIASNRNWSIKFQKAGLPLVGDDLQSQAGGTVVHKGLLEVLANQGVNLMDTYQLDVSGGLEGLNTLDDERRIYKRRVKETSISRAVPYGINVTSGTTDYLEFLGNRRIGHFWIKGTTFMGQPLTIDIRMETLDGSNGGAVLVEVIRAMKIALKRVTAGPVISISAHCFKYPPVFTSRTEGQRWFNEFIKGERIN